MNTLSRAVLGLLALVPAGCVTGARADSSWSYSSDESASPDWVYEMRAAEEERAWQRRREEREERRRHEADAERIVRDTERMHAAWREQNDREYRERQAKLDRWDEERRQEQERRYRQTLDEITRRK
jgi:hypothetical protein